MRVTADTNVILRAILGDDHAQAKVARDLLDASEIVAITVPTFCELAWVLHRTYRQSPTAIANVIRGLLNTANVATNASAVKAGLAILEAGGDFADGVIAFEGAQLGCETFVTFDREANILITRLGGKSRLLRS